MQTKRLFTTITMYKVTTGMMILLAFLIVAPCTLAIGYAPVSVFGTITDGGVAVVGAEVSLQVFDDGHAIAQSQRFFSDDAGLFFAQVTVADPSFFDIQMTIVADQTYVLLVEDATGWEMYNGSLDLSDDRLQVPADDLVVATRPTSLEVEEDMQRVADGSIVNDVALQEKYGVSVGAVPAQVSDDMDSHVSGDDSLDPVVENPTLVVDGDSIRSADGTDVVKVDSGQDVVRTLSFWQSIAVVLFVLLLGLVHLLVVKHRSHSQ